MALRPSRAPDISQLIDDLLTGDEVRRESAAARLTLIGTRAVDKLIVLAGDSTLSADVRGAALRTLGAIGDIRAVAPALSVLDNGPAPLALDAIELLGGVVGRDEPQATTAFERLAEIALAPRRDIDHRRAALAALDALPNQLSAPIHALLAGDAVWQHDRASHRQRGARPSLAQMVDEAMPDEPELFAAAIRDEAGNARLATLRKAVDGIRAQEQRAGDVAEAWRQIRAQVHQVLAARGSRVALYDVRETFERAKDVLPVGFYGTAAAIGDASILESLAATWTHAARSDDRQWRGHIADAFGAIVTREGLTRRHQTLKKILQRWPEAGVLVAKAKA